MGTYDKKPMKSVATAGPSEDDRFGRGPVATHLSARIVNFSIDGGTVRIMIAAGTDVGARANMTGYIKAGADGVLAEFQISEARHNVAFAYVPDLQPEDLQMFREVVINPSSRPPQPAGNVPARAIHVEAIPLGTRITISKGKANGIIEGTPGQLRSKEGRGSFVVSRSLLTRSYAIVSEPVDFVTANQELVLQRLSPKECGIAPVQRRANGEIISTRDVQSTARAGVADASSPLPHLDAIQRSFGKHDVSGVRAQIGGPAAAASRALGAQAYATGNTVAFASSPDLHTAAHEAAHVVQQSRGAVGAQGLGAADDEHERHADAVADSVVAGQSADPLLDQLVSGRAATAIQRKVMAPKLDHEAVQARAIVSGLRSAQRQLDEDRGARSSQAEAALPHLRHALTAAQGFGGGASAENVRRAANSFDRSIQRFSGRAKLAAREVALLVDLNRELREQLGVTQVSTRSDHHVEDSNADTQTGTALRASLELIAVRCEMATTSVEELGPSQHLQRDGILVAMCDEVDRSIAYVQPLLVTVPAERRAGLAGSLELAADKLGYLLRWIRSRTGYAQIATRYARTTNRFDRLLVAAGLPAIEMRTHALLTEKSLHAGDIEASELSTALAHFENVMDRWAVRQTAAVDTFSVLAALEDQQDPEIVADLLKAVFVAALGHFGGYLIGATMAKAGGALARTELMQKARGAAPRLFDPKHGEEIIRRVVDVSTDSVQSIAGAALQQTKTDAQASARAYFVAGMTIDVADRVARYRMKVAAMNASGEFSASQLRAVASVFEGLMEAAHDAYLQETTKAWAKYVVQSRLTRRLTGTVSDMKGYFGDQRADGVRSHGTSRAHGAGVLSIRLLVEPAGTKPRLDRKATQLLQMNSQMRAKILEGAGYRLEDVDLPKEVNVHTAYGRAVIALDERNAVRDVLDWHEVQRNVGVESGAKFWQLWGKDLSLK